MKRTFAIAEAEDDPDVRRRYRPFLHGATIDEHDWVSKLELSHVQKMAEEDLARTGSRLRLLVLYGSLRPR